jgi:hypothetical protein
MTSSPAAIVTPHAWYLHGLVVLDKDGAPWVVFEPRWWDVRAWCWYLLTRGPRGRLYVRMHQGRGPALVRAVRLAPQVLRLS